MWLVIGTDAPPRNTNWSDTVLILLGVRLDTMLPRDAVPVSRGLASQVPPANVVTRPICLYPWKSMIRPQPPSPGCTEMSTNRSTLLLPLPSGKKSVASLLPVGIFTPPPTMMFQLRVDVAGLNIATRASAVMSPSPCAFSLARASGPPARGDGMPHDASTKGMPAVRLNRGVNWYPIVAVIEF